MEMASPDQEDLGLGLKPGDPQYRAYVGPPEDYDLSRGDGVQSPDHARSAPASFAA